MKRTSVLASVLATLVACDAPFHAVVEFRNETAHAWGPCKGGPDGACDDGLFCSGDASHSICLPACGDGCPAIPAPLCGGGAPLCIDDGRCAFACSDDADCAALVGAECSATGVCAWPS